MTVRVLQGHVISVLSREPAGHYHTVCTSPPYLWARAYGTVPQTWPDGWVGELGQEPSPEQFVGHLVAVMEAVKRVLRDDGTLWVNLAGGAFNDPGGQNGSSGGVSPKAVAANAGAGRQKRQKHPWLKPLDWVDTPGMFAQAMQRAGWYWRSDITWVKPSPMPENVDGTHWARCRRKVAKSKAADPAGRSGYRQMLESPERYQGVNPDWLAAWEPCPGCRRCAAHGGYVLNRHNGRPTKATERILLFAKRPGAYYDAEGVREPVSEASLKDGRTARGARGTKGEYAAQDGNCGFDPARGRNLRNWWLLGPEPLRDEHYAAYPTGLPAKCITAGSSERGCCPTCGAPWARVLESEYVKSPKNGPAAVVGRHHETGSNGWDGKGYPRVDRATATLDWLPTCSCPERPPVPCRILDPFGGSGTTAIAADRLGRDCTLIELNPEYAGMAQRRVTKDAPLLTWGAVTVEGETAPPPRPAPLLDEAAG